MCLGLQFLHPQWRLGYGHLNIQALHTSWRIFLILDRCFDFGLSFVKKIIYGPYSCYLGVDVTNFQCRKMESNLALVLIFWCQKFKANCKELLGFNFLHQKLRIKNTRLLVSNFQHRKLKSKSTHLSVFNFLHQKLKTKSPVLWVFNFQCQKLNPKSLMP
jgi:hypothetical protein